MTTGWWPHLCKAMTRQWLGDDNNYRKMTMAMSGFWDEVTLVFRKNLGLIVMDREKMEFTVMQANIFWFLRLEVTRFIVIVILSNPKIGKGIRSNLFGWGEDNNSSDSIQWVCFCCDFMNWMFELRFCFYEVWIEKREGKHFQD